MTEYLKENRERPKVIVEKPVELPTYQANSMVPVAEPEVESARWNPKATEYLKGSRERQQVEIGGKQVEVRK